MSEIRVYYGTIIITYRNSQSLRGTRSLFYIYELIRMLLILTFHDCHK